MTNQLRVGIPVIGGQGWLGGASHMELHVKAVTSLPKEERPSLFLIMTHEMLEGFPLYRSFLTLFDGIIFMGNEIEAAGVIVGLPMIHCRNWDELFSRIDFFFPVSFSVLPDRCAASWVHDFQHKHLPEFFSTQDIAIRDELCRRIADYSRLVFCSSNAVEKDFRHFYPESKAITRVLALRVSPEEEWYSGDPLAVQQQYGLPDRFILCCNQFWIHKNHRLLFEAVALMHQSGQDVHLVCTGLTSDFRYPGYMDELEQTIDKLGITKLVHILGQIPRHDQIQLIRRSLFVVQPSLFEGLGLIVQESRTLGKPIILSDLDVHKEHQYGIYFQRHSAPHLASKLAALLPVCQPGPDIYRETESKLQAYDLAVNYAQEFVKLTEEAQQLFAQQSPPAKCNSPCSRMLLVTSLQTTGYTDQAQCRAVDSWLQAGFTVVSLNRPNDIGCLQSRFPQVTFIAVQRDGESHRTPCVYFDDILDYLEGSEADVCGLIEPDICLYGYDLAARLASEAANCIVYQDKIQVQSLLAFEGNLFSRMGCLFFDRRLVRLYPRDNVCLGQPLWDYWAILLPVLNKVPVKRITTPFAYHVIHAEQYDMAALLSYGKMLDKYAPPPFDISEETLCKYQLILAQIIKNHSIELALPGLTTL